LNLLFLNIYYKHNKMNIINLIKTNDLFPLLAVSSTISFANSCGVIVENNKLFKNDNDNVKNDNDNVKNENLLTKFMRSVGIFSVNTVKITSFCAINNFCIVPQAISSNSVQHFDYKIKQFAENYNNLFDNTAISTYNYICNKSQQLWTFAKEHPFLTYTIISFPFMIYLRYRSENRFQSRLLISCEENGITDDNFVAKNIYKNCLHVLYAIDAIIGGYLWPIWVF
jgi:hypothetical protein